MTSPARLLCRTILISFAASAACALLSAPVASAQQNTSANSPEPITLSGSITYHDAFSDACDKANPPSGPFAGQNPLTCHAESAPTDSNGQCTLKGMTLVQKQGNTCYYCSPIDPPLVGGILIPLDNVQQASLQGYTCGVDEFDQNCMAVCSRQYGSGPLIPAPGTVTSSTPVPKLPAATQQTQQPGPPPGYAPQPGPPLQAGAANPCEPFGPGGYNYCANPTQPKGCVCTKQTTPPAPQPNTASTGGLPLPLATRQAVLQAAAQMDQIANDTSPNSLAASDPFFKCLTQAVSADLKFLGQSALVPAAQMAQSLHTGVTNYLNSDATKNNLQTYQDAQQSLNRLTQNAACAVAKALPALLGVAAVGTGVAAGTAGAAGAAGTGTTVTVAGTGAITLAGTGAVAATAAATAAATQNAAKNALKLAASNQARAAAWGSGPARAATPPINQFNPTCAPNMCFPAAIAQDLTLQTGESLASIPFAGNVTVQILNNVPTNVFNLTGNKTVESMLQTLYGAKPLQGPALDVARLQNQLLGIASEMTPTAIQQELTAAGPGARGLIFIEYPPTTANPYGTGHVVNGITNSNGVAQAIDASNANMDATTFFNGASKISFYRTQ
jgi:hypothetical protein